MLKLLEFLKIYEDERGVEIFVYLKCYHIRMIDRKSKQNVVIKFKELPPEERLYKWIINLNEALNQKINDTRTTIQKSS